MKHFDGNTVESAKHPDGIRFRIESFGNESLNPIMKITVGNSSMFLALEDAEVLLEVLDRWLDNHDGLME